MSSGGENFKRGSGVPLRRCFLALSQLCACGASDARVSISAAQRRVGAYVSKLAKVFLKKLLYLKNDFNKIFDNISTTKFQKNELQISTTKFQVLISDGSIKKNDDNVAQ